MKQLIVVIVNQGFQEEVMKSARENGARGGTIFNARGTYKAQEEVEFLGIKLQPDKEIVFILTDDEHKNQIMQGIKQNSGLITNAAGIIFSLPVDSFFGISADNPPQSEQEDNQTEEENQPTEQTNENQ